MMIHRLLLLTGLAASLSARPLPSPTTVGAVYFITNDPSANNVMMHTINKDGSLVYADYVSTAGKGSHGNPGQPLGGDGLFSQGSVQVSGNHLLVVNSGSNTVSMFNINPRDPTQLTMIGKPVSSGGDFPISLAVSPKTGNVCVLNGGASNSVQCFFALPNGLHPIAGTHIPLNVSTISTPPTGPPNTFSQIMFYPDGSKLFVSYKGIPPADASSTAVPGWIATWTVSPSGLLSSTHTKTPAAAGALLPFSMTPIANTQAILNTDPAVGFSIYDFSKTPTISKSYAIEGQMATCWSEFSKGTGTFFLTDGATGIITEVAVDSKTLNAKILKQYPQSSGGTLDETIVSVGGKDFLYVLNAGSTAIDVLALNGPGNATALQTISFAEVQYASGSPVASGAYVQGMAAFLM